MQDSRVAFSGGMPLTGQPSRRLLVPPARQKVSSDRRTVCLNRIAGGWTRDRLRAQALEGVMIE
jgi:hypothetical protein